MEKLCLKGFVQSFGLIKKKNFFALRLYDVLRQIYRINFFLYLQQMYGWCTLYMELRNNLYLQKQFQFYLHKRHLNNRIFGIFFGLKEALSRQISEILGG